METKKTSLYQLHQDCNAKFVEFAGYQMPIQYSEGIVEEHKFTRNHSGIFDVSHMGQLFIYGCLLYTSPSPRDGLLSRMPSSA